MTDLGMLLFWKATIVWLVWTLISFVLLEFSLDKQKREENGILRVKRNGFVVRFIYNSFIGSHPKNPKSLCQLFWGIWIGGAVNLFLIWVAYVFIFHTIPACYIGISAKITMGGFWSFVKPFLIGICIAIAIIGLVLLLCTGEVMPATREWVVSKKKKICPMIKLVD